MIFTIPALMGLTKPGFFPTQDYIYVARVYQMDKSLKDGQFPVRWVPDFRYGEPLYNFYAPLPYYVGSVLKPLLPSYLITVKVLFALGFIFSGLAMYFLASYLFGNLAGFLSSMLYVYAPYHSVDIYVRGALSESWALIFFPLVFLASFKLNEKVNIRNFLFLSLSLAGLFYTHNVMTMLFTPFLLGFIAYLIFVNKTYTNIKFFTLAFIFAISLSASFLIPAFFERGYVQTDKLIRGYFDFRGHFVAWPQFFSTFWGYGASLWGSKDDMSFQIGIIHWILFATSITVVFFKNTKFRLLAIFLALEFLFSLFMQHNQSAPIWETIKVLEFTQFPWRFLGISIFLISILGGLFVYFLNEKFKKIVFILTVVTVLFNINYFKPESFYLDSIDDHYISTTTLSKDDRLPKDYLPIWVKKIEDQKRQFPYAVSGEIKVSNYQKRSSTVSFKAKVEQDGEVEVPITYFPGWEVLVNGKKVQIQEPSDLGLIKFKLVKGEYIIKMRFASTPLRAFSDMLTYSSFFVLVILLLKNLALWKK